MNLFWTSTGNKLIRRTQVVSFMIADHNIGQQYFTRTSNKNDWRNQSKRELEQSGRFKQPIVTEILKASTFYPAEEEHQDFYKKNEEYYLKDREKSGRDEFIDQNWN